MSSSIADVSSKLGEYMLKGWVLTDQSCTSSGCSVPLMRSPNGRSPTVHLCVNCDGISGESRPNPISSSTSSAATESNNSRSSTPPTEVSIALSSPVFAPPAETDESRRRREQSDLASTEIGKRLLKGWAMLGDECPNASCFGVPLVRPPKAGGEKDSRKECVVCGRIYVTEIDWAGRERLVLTNSEASTQPNNSSSTANPTTHASMKPHQPHPMTPSPVTLVETTASIPTLKLPPEISATDNFRLQILEESASALQSTLHTLSTRLKTISDPQIVLDLSSISATADAISKVTQALSHVRQLQWSESHAQGL